MTRVNELDLGLGRSRLNASALDGTKKVLSLSQMASSGISLRPTPSGLLHHIYAGTSHTAVVFIDGACPSNGPSAHQAAIGVYFGPGSPNNFSRTLAATDSENGVHPTNQIAELSAAVEALRHVRTVVAPHRRDVLRAGAPNNRQHEIMSARRFRLVVATDSSYLVDCLCTHMEGWTWRDTMGQYVNRAGRAIKNGELFRTLSDEVEQLSMVGVQVAWYLVPRRFNREADALAHAALSGAPTTPTTTTTGRNGPAPPAPPPSNVQSTPRQTSPGSAAGRPTATTGYVVVVEQNT
ncbi:Ribonuclease H-like protein [Niveomyces insectorum RCEF 264]|uniref:ribonuclease H n=1 Tax=Niveomyces insectorum RCEF 264 TaxID=1081102 RepID=A0A167P2S9_9HYPO|nr:Ribonuclease H-like protein [Niveomyces insectorum RCEF 264]